MKILLLLAIDPFFSVDASYTYWIPEEDGLAIYYQIEEAPTIEDSSLFFPKQIGQSGVKAGVSVKLDSWMIGLSWEWFSKNDTYEIPLTMMGTHDDSLRATWGVSSNPDDFFMDKDYLIKEQPDNNSWNGTFQRGALLFSYNYQIGQIAIRPSSGVMATWREESLFFTYLTKETEAKRSRLITRQESWGVGPYMSIRNEFFLVTDLSHRLFIVGSSGIALPWSEGDGSVDQYNGETSDETTDPTFSYSSDIKGLYPIIDGSIGIGWGANIDNHFNMALSLSWELQVWLGYNSIFPAKRYSYKNALYSMHGVTASINLSL